MLHRKSWKILKKAKKRRIFFVICHFYHFCHGFCHVYVQLFEFPQVTTPVEYEMITSSFPYHSSALDLQEFPKQFPFSAMVPRCVMFIQIQRKSASWFRKKLNLITGIMFIIYSIFLRCLCLPIFCLLFLIFDETVEPIGPNLLVIIASC